MYFYYLAAYETVSWARPKGINRSKMISQTQFLGLIVTREEGFRTVGITSLTT
jgi:hypothetical protein